MSIVPVRDKDRDIIIPVRDQKRIIITPSGKTKNINIASRNIVTPSSLTNYSNVSETIEELNIENSTLKEEIKELGNDNVLIQKVKDLDQRIKYQEDEINTYLLYCPKFNKDIKFARCKYKRKIKECPRLCVEAQTFAGI